MQPPFTKVGNNLDGNPDTSSPGNSMSRADLRGLLVAKDGEYELDALSMAAITFNVDIILLVTYACGECDQPPYSMSRCTVSPHELNDDDKAHKEDRDQLRKATQEVIDRFGDDPHFCQCLETYSKDLDFNFLPREEYFFHFLCSTHRSRKAYREALRKKVRSFPANLWRFLLELHDSQGRTPTHVALERNNLKSLLSLVKDGGDDEREVVICALTTPDAAGRTPAYSAAALGRDEGSSVLLEHCREYPDIFASCTARFIHSLQKNDAFFSRNLSFENQGNLALHFGSMFKRNLNPIHASIIFRGGSCSKLWIEASLNPDLDWGDVAFYEKQFRLNQITQTYELYKIEWDPIEFAYLVEPDTRRFGIQLFLKEKALSIPRSFSRYEAEDGTVILKHPYPILHIVARFGKFQNLKFLIDDFRIDPFIEDYEENSVLHRVLKG